MRIKFFALIVIFVAVSCSNVKLLNKGIFGIGTYSSELDESITYMIYNGNEISLSRLMEDENYSYGIEFEFLNVKDDWPKNYEIEIIQSNKVIYSEKRNIISKRKERVAFNLENFNSGFLSKDNVTIVVSINNKTLISEEFEFSE